MGKTTLYGIPNCDTVKKARRFLDKQQHAYNFHDFRKDGCDSSMIQTWVTAGADASLINKRSTTWKSLDKSEKLFVEDTLSSLPDKQSLTALSNADKKRLYALLANNPTLIKRPVLLNKKNLVIGFKEAIYQTIT